jgi:rSAM/selenodomain-associated transferase 1
VPVAGRIKTRLAAGIGAATAVRFARHCTAALLQRVAAGAPWQTTVAVAPDSGITGPIWPRGLRLVPQGGGDLGTRMQRIFDRAGPGPLVIVGTDVPGIASAHLRAAFRLLGRHDAVFGPAADGGYWLVGLKRRPRVLRPFHGVRWSTRHALADTLANLRGRSVAFVDTLSDVDTAADFARCAAFFGRRVLAPYRDLLSAAN